MRKICNFVIKYSLYALVFFIPLFWLPWTVEAYEFNKQYLLVFLVALAFLAWLAKMTISQKKISFRRTPLDLWILVFMFIMILSGIFSIDKISSWFGFYGRFSDSIVGILSLGVMYFVVVNNFSLKKNKSDKSSKGQGLSLQKILNLTLASSWIVVIIAYLSVFNVWSKIPGLPEIISYKSFNTVGGSLESLSIFLVAIIGVLMGGILTAKNMKKIADIGKGNLAGNKKNKIKEIFNNCKNSGPASKVVLIIISTILLVLINSWAAWLSLGVMTFFLIIMAFWTRIFRWNTNLLMLPIILLLISLFFLSGFNAKIGILNDIPFFSADLPQELVLDSNTSKLIAWQTFKDYPVLGSGPGTYISDFVRYKPVEFNDGDFWNIRFDKGSSHLMEMVGTVGVLGILSYLLILFIFLLIMSLSLQRMRDKGESKTKEERIKNKASNRDKLIILPFFLGWLALAAGQFVYLQNTTLSFYFWLFTALGIVGWQKIQSVPYRKTTFSFKKMPEIGLVMNIILLIIVFAVAGLFYLGGRFYYVDMLFKQPAETNEALLVKMERIVNLNGYRENYRRALSQVYLINAWNEANKPEGEQNIQLLQALAAGSIEQARIASSVSPNSVSVWENLGNIYRDSQGLVGGTIPFALEAFAKASELEPNNPFFYRERCRLNLISEEKDWDETVDYCQRAVELKENYLDAHIQLALVYEEKGDLERAIEQMEAILVKLKGVSFQRGSDLAGAATEIYFQLGRLYFNLERIEEAIPMFEQAVIINQQYANARYALALSYQTAGRNEDALIQYQIINQLIPNNEDIKTIIEQLSGPAPVEEEVVEE